MRYLLLLVLALPLSLQAQDWKKQCTTYTGDVVRPGDSVKILTGSAPKLLEVMRPHFNYTDDVWFQYRDHITFFLNGTHEISRVTRVTLDYSKKKREWIPVVVVSDKMASTSEDVEFTIELDKGLKMGLIEIVHKETPEYTPSHARTSN